jgi:organic hydroperoxide reductase OsmC/OhrA
MTFSTEAVATNGKLTAWTAESAGHQIAVAVPPEFSGPGGALSPEDLYAQALTNCFVGTFKVLAENSRLTFTNLEAQGRLSVDYDELRRPCMRAFHLSIGLQGSSDQDKAKRIIDKAMQSGFILNSVKTTITHEAVLT